MRIAASASLVVELVDDRLRLSGNMTKRSLLMGGDRSGIENAVDPNPPRTKTCQSVGEPLLLVIGP